MVIEGVSPYRAYCSAVNDRDVTFIDWLSWINAGLAETALIRDQ
jgi:hypothetical protein